MKPAPAQRICPDLDGIPAIPVTVRLRTADQVNGDVHLCEWHPVDPPPTQPRRQRGGRSAASGQILMRNHRDPLAGDSGHTPDARPTAHSSCHRGTTLRCLVHARHPACCAYAAGHARRPGIRTTAQEVASACGRITMRLATMPFHTHYTCRWKADARICRIEGVLFFAYLCAGLNVVSYRCTISPAPLLPSRARLTSNISWLRRSVS
jgi:hypothetical protein